MAEAAILNTVFGHILVINEDIRVKLGMQIDSGHTRVTAAQYLTFGKIQDGGSRDTVRYGKNYCSILLSKNSEDNCKEVGLSDSAKVRHIK